MSQKRKRGCLHIVTQPATVVYVFMYNRWYSYSYNHYIDFTAATHKHPSNKGYLYNLVFCICAGLPAYMLQCNS